MSAELNNSALSTHNSALTKSGRIVLRQVAIQALRVEAAVRLALEQLGRTRDQVSVEVLATDPGSEEVLVRVTARETKGDVSEEEASPKRRMQRDGEARGPVTRGVER